MLVGSSLQFELYQLRAEFASQMPSQHYQVEASGSFKSTSGLLVDSPAKPGEGTLRVTDVRSKGEYYE